MTEAAPMTVIDKADDDALLAENDLSDPGNRKGLR